MHELQLPQGYSHFEEAVYFLPFSSQKFLVLILSTLEGWKAESTLETPSGNDLYNKMLRYQIFIYQKFTKYFYKQGYYLFLYKKSFMNSNIVNMLIK